MIYVSEEELRGYNKLKKFSYERISAYTPQECYNNFRKTQKLNSESYVQFASRFVNNARRKVKADGPLEADELYKAEIFLIKGVQSQEFSVDIKCLQQQPRVLPQSKLKSLNPFLDSNGVLRVGGRLAVHIEVVSHLTSDAFIATLKRFMARRGKCAKLFSDNAKNFVTADKEIKKLHEMVKKPDDQLARYLAAEGIKWKFIPPRSPNFGGL
ncbi:integrase catalytic domain-containing protein [Trichonephila clavipes]|nr:integrase catalytic domain-containing protein [Trichonephila clavipes]